MSAIRRVIFMAMGFMFFALMSAFLTPVVCDLTGGPAGSTFLGIAVTLIAVSLTVEKFTASEKGGILGFNTYHFNFLAASQATCVGVIAADLIPVTKMCRAIGYLWKMAGKGHTTFRSVMGAAKLTTNMGVTELLFESKYRLPNAIEPAILVNQTDALAGTHTGYDGAGSCSGALVSLDEACGNQMTNLDKQVLNAGDLVVAVLAYGADVGPQTEAQLIIPMCAGQRLIIALANQNAQDGVYQDPFATADGVLAKAFIGTPGQRANQTLVLAGV